VVGQFRIGRNSPSRSGNDKNSPKVLHENHSLVESLNIYPQRWLVKPYGARDWMLENKVNQTSFKVTRAKLRDMMPWIKKGALVDKTKN
jgi:hypothetical protein